MVWRSFNGLLRWQLSLKLYRAEFGWTKGRGIKALPKS
jgi:hypothetical protein